MNKSTRYLRIIGVILLFITTFTLTYAWYVNNNEKKVDVDTSVSGGYFAGGDGTKENPYIIKNKNHIYNLAWLQYFGKFQNRKYYFEVKNDINMNGMVIPPIGTDTYPFIGEFNGNNYTISNFSATNDYNSLTNKPNSITNISSAYVGMFGIIGSLDTTYDSTNIPYVSSFYIDNYQTIVSDNSKSLSGILAGYINGKAEKVGIHYAKISYQAKITPLDNYSVLSKYTLFGDYNKNSIEWKDDTGSEGLGYGSSFDVQKLAKRLLLIYNNKQSSTPSPFLPSMEEQNVLGSLQKIPLTVNPDSITEANYSKANAKEDISSENIGYLLGNQIKINDKTIAFSSKLNAQMDNNGNIDNNKNYLNEDNKTPMESEKVPLQFFEMIGSNGDYHPNTIRPISDETYNSLPENIKNLLSDTQQSIKYSFLRLSQRWSGSISIVSGDQNDAWSDHGTIEYFGKEYEKVILPNNGIWFKPQIAGKIKFVVFSGNDSNNNSFSLIKIKRANADKNNPFNSYNSKGENTISGEKITSSNGKPFITKNLPQYLFLYYEYEITESEINDGNTEYLLLNGDSNGAYFLYLDIGTNGGSTTNTNVIENVDFVYKINYIYSAFSDKSNVTFSITNSNTVIFYFKRISNNNTAVVYYYVNPSTNGGITKAGNGNSNEGKETDFN